MYCLYSPATPRDAVKTLARPLGDLDCKRRDQRDERNYTQMVRVWLVAGVADLIREKQTCKQQEKYCLHLVKVDETLFSNR